MSFSTLRPLYPQPAAGLTSQVTTVTAGSTAVTGFNIVPPNAVQLVTFDVQVSDVYVLWEGSTPTGSAGGGHLLPVGTAYTWASNQYNSAKFIRASSATADAIIVASPMNGG